MLNRIGGILSYIVGRCNMHIQYNSRQIPSNKQYTANKEYSDLIYGYLQQQSVLDEKQGIRYVQKKDMNYTKIGQILELTRQTVSKKIGSLIEQGLLYYDEENKRYILTELEASLAALLPCDTVRILCVNLKERSLSVLVYLIKSYYQHNCEPFEINLDVMKDFVGLNVDNRGRNNQIMKDILLLLQKLGLVDYRIDRVMDEKTGGYRTKYIIEKVDNSIQF